MILDTNALSAFVGGNPAVGVVLRSQSRAAIPVIVLGEFRYGISLSRHRVTYDKWLRTNLPRFEILAVTEDTTLAYAAVRFALKTSGKPIPANDAWIASLALQHQLPILSRDRHFDVLDGISRVDW